MVSLLWSQLKSMFIKDQLIRRRHYIATLFELFLPIVMVLIHVWTVYSKSDQQQPISIKSTGDNYNKSGTFGSLGNLLNDDDVVSFYNKTFQCYSFGQSVFYTSPDSVVSKIWTPDYRTCNLETVQFETMFEVIKAWGDSYKMSSYSANTGLYVDSFDLDNGIANFTVSGQAIDYSGDPWSKPVYATFDDYLRTQSIVNILLANYPNEQKLISNDFNYFYTTKLFDEGNPINDQLTSPSAFKDSGGSSRPPAEVLDFYQSYTILEIGFLYLSTLITRRIVREKMTNSKELLRIMGLTDLIYWFSHFINYFSLSIFHGSLITIIYSIIVDKSPYSGWNPTLFWFNYVTNSVTSILFSFAFTTILTRPVIGVLIVIVGRAGLAYLPFAAKTATFKILWISPKVWASLLPSGQLHYSINDLLYFGRTNGKVHWSDIFSSAIEDDTLALWSIYLLMMFSWLFYILLIWYIDAIWPWQSGTPKKWHFPVSQFLKSATVGIEISSTAPYQDQVASYNETEPVNLRPNIKCVNLYKSFDSSGAKFAVDCLNLNILKGQITVLLGHNGAGKTTTMSMITGILTPSSGNIYVNGIDVHKDTVAARRCLALCPQHDLLFEELTVKENLNLCAGLRGLSDQIKKNLIPLNIKRVNLEEKANTLASNLSGGMRRRLQLALALSTASEILILDEPTSGLDPESRRQLWDLLLELRKDLTILLTTHFMEEADSLGDRIIIMGSGKVKCSGSPMFLKKRFGTGYSVRAAKDAFNYQSTKFSKLIKSYFLQAVVTTETNAEFVYQLNDGSESESTSSLADLCDTLDTNLTSLGITSYGISVTTLEDVFLKVAEDEDENKQSTAITMEDKLFELNKILDYTKLTGLSLIMQRFKGLVLKRFHYTKRHYKTISFTMIIPALVIIFSLLASRNAMSNVIIRQSYDHSIPLDVTAIYGSNAKAVIRASFTGSSPFIDSYRQIMKESGIDVIEIKSTLSMDDYFKSSSQNREQFMNENVFGILEDSSKPKGFSAWLNPKAALSLPLSITAWQNALIRTLSDGKRNQSKVSVTYKQMPNTATLEPKYKAIVARIIFALFSPVAFCLIAVSYFLFPSLESQNKCNLIQKMNGIRAPMFWLSHYAFDLTYHLIVTIIIFLSMIIVDQFPFVAFKVTASILLLLILYGLASIPLFYLFSFLPLTPDRGFSLLSTFSLVGTLIGSGIAASLMAFDKVKSLHVILGDLFPPFAASFGLSKIYGAVTRYTECKAIDACPNGNRLSKEYCCTSDENYKPFTPFAFKDGGIATEIIMLLVGSIVYTLLLIVLDENLHRLGYWYETIRKKLSNDGESVNVIEDEDVTSERERIKQLIRSNTISNEALIVDGLSKSFGSFKAVDAITFGVHKAECFGLLGVNGAGKTTTFRMLTGDLMVSYGDAYVGSYSLRKDLLNFQQSISYCPQFDALLDNLTPIESLMLFARIRGMPEDKVKDNVNYIIGSTDLTRFANTCNQNLSGGNKRKLSLAIASIAKPEVIFLDEPTTGVDPASRRKIWSTLIHLRDTSGSSIVLTSHSMDECEALCSRIGIMAKGNFKCLGSSQHLKQKFGLGFTLIIKMKDQQQNQQQQQQQQSMEKVKLFIKEKFPSSNLRDVHQTILHYHITDTSLRWGQMLRCLDEGKRLLPIDDFTLTGTTLEQIFLSFAKQT